MSARSTKATTAGEVAKQTTPRGSGDNGKLSYLSLRERAARGKAARADVPRSVHGEWTAPPARRDPVELLEAFWLVSALALNGRVEEARGLFERLLGLANDLGLLSEEYDVSRRRQVGNFPRHSAT